MASINKITRKSTGGDRPSVSWQLVYFKDVLQDGQIVRKRVRKNFRSKAEADAARIDIEHQLKVSNGEALNDQITLLRLAEAWLDYYEGLVKKGDRERSTFESYAQHVHVHMKPAAISSSTLSQLSVPKCQIFLDSLTTTRSTDMISRVKATLIQVMSFGVTRGYLRINYFKETSLPIQTDRQDEEIYVPTEKDVMLLISKADEFDPSGKLAALICLLATAGIRISELRGLRLCDLLNLTGPTPRINISQRADRWGRIGPCKTKNSKRSIPLPSSTANALLRWLSNRPLVPGELVFPNARGKPESYFNLRNRIWVPFLRSVKMTKLARPIRLRDIVPFAGPGSYTVDGEYSSVTEQTRLQIHDLRHFYASINIKQGVQPKKLQHLMGHSNLSTTMDTYAKLWEDVESDNVIAAGLQRLFA